jgi:glutamate 5-kinase
MVQDSDKRIFFDNDSLAALVAGETNVDLVILLSDVEGLYKEPPSASGKKGELIDTYQVPLLPAPSLHIAS